MTCRIASDVRTSEIMVVFNLMSIFDNLYKPSWIPGQARDDKSGDGSRVKPGMTFEGPG